MKADDGTQPRGIIALDEKKMHSMDKPEINPEIDPELDPQATGADDDIVGLARFFGFACTQEAHAEMACPRAGQHLDRPVEAEDTAKARTTDLAAAVTSEVRRGLEAPGAATTGA